MTIVYTRPIVNDAIDTQLTTRITCTGSAVAVTGPNVSSTNGFLVTRVGYDTSTIYFAGTGAGSAVGFPLVGDDKMVLSVANLSFVEFYGSASQVVVAAKL